METRGHAKSVGKIFLGGLLGFAFWTLTSHPRSKVNQRLPEKKYKNLHISSQEGAYLKVHKGNKTFHLHHWLILSGLYLPIIAIRKNILKSKILHGFFLGSIIQGLVYKDRFHIIKRLEKIVREEKIIR
ncbi:MAG: hypothetical protein A2857_05605 [Candidatus Levybacteria bacterium RIFCSPHIGHO2_01_FULL_36_15]|nr:MAG: hypothetical protein A2857_05605 [Candidatus Levybacteria bacterium RIFCSPHIGHO2_01_FULL_36_15]OGH38993.1 MAG: hypothetical protein A2905_04755 [Candidatus Levybacteria bacterium RIFCSPLOWO2_01_FULL_36_10]